MSIISAGLGYFILFTLHTPTKEGLCLSDCTAKVPLGISIGLKADVTTERRLVAHRCYGHITPTASRCFFFFICCWALFANTVLRIFMWVLTGGIGLYLSCDIFRSCFGERVILVSEWVGKFPCLYFLKEFM